MLIFSDFSKKSDGAKTVTDWAIRHFTESQIQAKCINLLPSSSHFFGTRRIVLGLIGSIKLIYFRIRGQRVIYIPLAGGSQLFLQLGILFLATKLGFVCYLHHHSYSYIDAPSRFLKITFRSLSKYSKHIFLTDEMHFKFSTVFRFNPTSFVISNATVVSALLSKFEYNLDEQSRDFGLVHFGRLSAEKGIYRLLSVYSKLLILDPKIHCFLAGDTDDEEVTIFITKLQRDFPERFHYTGVYNLVDIPKLVENAQFFLFPSFYSNEAAPLVVYEAQHMGLVCLATDVGSLSTVVKAPGTAFRQTEWEVGVLEYLMKFFSSVNDESYRFLQQARQEIKGATRHESQQGILEMTRICEEIIKIEKHRQTSSTVS